MAKRGRLAFEAFSFSTSDLPQMKLGAKTAATKERAATLSSKAAKRPRSGDKLSDKRDRIRLSNGEKAVFVAPKPAKYRERYSNVCKSCFDASLPCDHGPPEVPLRLLLIGHNPSEHAWKSGFLYSNPTNRMMRLLTGASIGRDAPPFTGLLPQGTPIEAQNEMPARFGIGLTDLGLEPGNNAADYGKKRMLEWAEGLYTRLAAHQRRAGGSPNLVAFTGKRQFRMIFPSEVGKIDHGEWTGPMPPGWPFSSSTRVWVLPSSSGRAVMSHAERTEPYRALAAAYHALSGTVIPKSEPDEKSLREDAS